MAEVDKDIFRLTIELARWQGLHIGTLKGILWWEDLPKELKSNLENRIKELESETTPIRKNLVQTVLTKRGLI
tara:strand:+ start:50 stop:268 length:219 start_codon:yes stop_codon:yes gene_type:complete